MRALVVYESMYGNTHVVATNIADGLRTACEVTLVPVSAATRELVSAADILVAGGPTHMHGMSSTASRRMAADAARKEGSALELDPDAAGPGLRDWLRELGTSHLLVAAYDTRFSGPPVFTGRASRGISRLLKQRGCRLVAAPESFLVTKQNTLADGESSRARRWGVALSTTASNAASAARADGLKA
jgi:hypothetical protein